MEGKILPKKSHYWLLSYIFNGGNGFIFVDTSEQYISPATINKILENYSTEEKKIIPASVSYLGFMTKQQASKCN